MDGTKWIGRKDGCMMNYYSKTSEKPAGSRGGYVFGCDHMFFSDYAKCWLAL
jgi:hypothetical protein